MRSVKDMKVVTPILSDLPPPETLTHPNGGRSGNAEVRRAVTNGELQDVARAYERLDGKGRGFGFTGAHNHISWQNDGFQIIVLNAILWTARRDTPKKGEAGGVVPLVEYKLLEYFENHTLQLVELRKDPQHASGCSGSCAGGGLLGEVEIQAEITAVDSARHGDSSFLNGVSDKGGQVVSIHDLSRAVGPGD